MRAEFVAGARAPLDNGGWRSRSEGVICGWETRLAIAYRATFRDVDEPVDTVSVRYDIDAHWAMHVNTVSW